MHTKKRSARAAQAEPPQPERSALAQVYTWASALRSGWGGSACAALAERFLVCMLHFSA